MSRKNCDAKATEILRLFGAQSTIRYSIGGFDGDWPTLKALVTEWWDLYRIWEGKDTLEAAYREQRLTVKGTTTMNQSIQAQTVPRDLHERYQQADWGPTTTYTTPIVKTNASIKARLDPKVFVPEDGSASRKTELGYHDLSALLLNPKAPISAQQFKGRDDITANQIYAFMPLSHAMDQAVFQNINTLAKIHREDEPGFYDTVRDIRSKLTRIKLAAEHDMAVNFVRVPRLNKPDVPKFQYTLIHQTDVSTRDEDAGAIPKEKIFSKLTLARIEEALDKANPPLYTNSGDTRRLAKHLVLALKDMLNKEFKFEVLKSKVDATFADRKVQSGLSKLKPLPSAETLAFAKSLILDNAGGKTKQNYRTNVGIHEARQRAAINFQTLVLGEIMRYAEITIAYRQHAGSGAHAFPKFARFDSANKLWIVVDIGPDNSFSDRVPAERFADQPV